MRNHRVRIALGLCLTLSSAWAPGAAQTRQPTTDTSIGIFYQSNAPATRDLWRDGDAGQRLVLQGRVLDTAGRPVAGALVELWHADAVGSVDESRYRARQRTPEDGTFGIKTVLPGHIERARDNLVFAARHVHVVVSHPQHERLVSLIYFKGDERFAGNPYPELAVALDEASSPAGKVLFGRVELVLRSAGD